MTDDQRLLDTLEMIQARGPIGERSLPAAVAHADRFVALLPAGQLTLVDLGSGGGLPALVIAWRRPDVKVTMIERRQTRADLLRRALGALALADRAEVVAAEVEAVADASGATFDVVTARSFGSPEKTAAAVVRLLGAGGVALISEPPRGRDDEWQAALRRSRGLVDLGVEQGIRRLRRG
jgi:16S rRNA G527 N7-methylase RsmG